MVFMELPTDAGTQQHRAAGQQSNAAQKETPPTAQESSAAALQAPAASKRPVSSLVARNRQGMAASTGLMQEKQAEPESASNTNKTGTMAKAV